MPHLPDFAVILPLYKGEAFLEQTLDSVLAQTHPPAEILALDDGSPDRSGDLVERFARQHAAALGGRLRLLRKPNSGVSDTRNQGAHLASAEFLCFLDQDDVWLPDHLARHAAVLAAHPQADVCYSGRRHLVENLRTHTFSLSAPIPVPTADRLPAHLLDRCPFTPSAVSLRRSTFLAAGGFDSRHNSVEDWDLWLRLRHRGARFVHSPEPTLHYRVHAAANTNDPLPVLRKNLGVVQQNILPHLSPLARLTTGRRIVSRLQAEAAILLRENRTPGALPLMLQSLLHHPLHQPRRYKLAAHMLLHGPRR